MKAGESGTGAGTWKCRTEAYLPGGYRARVSRPSGDRDQDVLRLQGDLRRSPEHPHLPRVPRASGGFARHQREGRRAGGYGRARAQLRRGRQRYLRQEELLLPRPSQGVPDLPVRRADLHRRPHRRPHPRRQDPGRHHSAPPGGGRGEERPRRHLGPHARLRRLPHRLQPRRHAPDGDRHRTRHPIARSSPRYGQPAEEIS